MDQMTSDESQYAIPPKTTRRAVVDLGSNSVRLVIYEGEARNPVQIFNEKAVLRLAKGMTKTGGSMNRHGAGGNRAAPLRRHRARHGGQPVRGAGNLRRARCRKRPGIRCQLMRQPAGNAHQRPLRRTGGRSFRPRACSAASPARMACWRISAAARWSWCGWMPAASAQAAPCRSASSAWQIGQAAIY
jgi:hypothetical protein